MGADYFITGQSLYSLGPDLAVEFTAFEHAVGHPPLVCSNKWQFIRCKNLKLRDMGEEKVHTTSELGALIEHTSEVTVMIFGSGVGRETMHRAVFDAGCNTDAA